MRRAFILLILSIAPAWAASPVFMFTGTNEMIAAPVPRVNTNLWAVLSGHTNKNDGWGGIFEFVTNNAATIDWTNTFPASVSNARWRRVVQPVGTNAPAQLTVMGKLGVGTQAPDQEAEVNVNQNSDTELRVKNTTSGANAYAGISLITDNSGTLEMAAFSTDWTSGLASSVARSAMVRSSSLSGGLVLAALGSNPVSIWTDDVQRVTISSGGVVNIAGLTASKPVFTDGSKNLTSTGTVPYANLPIRTLSSQYTSVVNVGAGEDTLQTYTMPGGTLAADGDRLLIRACGYFAATANNKTLKYYFGSNVITLVNAVAVSGEMWWLEVELFRSTSGNAITHSTKFSRGVNAANVTIYAVRNENGVGVDSLASNLIIKLTGEATATSDIDNFSLSVTYYAAP